MHTVILDRVFRFWLLVGNDRRVSRTYDRSFELYGSVDVAPKVAPLNAAVLVLLVGDAR